VTPDPAPWSRKESAEEAGDGGDHALLFIRPELGEDGKGQNLACGALALREIPLAIAQESQRLLEVERQRIVDLAADLPLRQVLA
jgi:hypothetical protein